MSAKENYAAFARSLGCPRDQVFNFVVAGVTLQERQLMASIAARECDRPDGPTAVGYGGARGGGKSHWLLAQMGADDCQRVSGLKCLLLRKVGKANLEHFEDLRRRVFWHLKHKFTPTNGVLTFANGSRIIAGHFQHESDIDAYLGLQYDVIGIEEATTLTYRKFQDILTCCRTSRPWRPRVYSTTNPGGVGHAWYRRKFIEPCRAGAETDTRFITAKVTDNQFNNPEYQRILEGLSGWQKRAWLHGDWDIAAGQFFTNFRRDVHVLKDFDRTRATEWLGSLDYGFTHYTVVLLGCKDGDGNLYILDEHAERMWLPERHAVAIQNMLARHGLARHQNYTPRGYPRYGVTRFFAGMDVFSAQSDGSTIASQYKRLGIDLSPANTDRIQGWAEVLRRLGDVDAGIRPTLFIHQRCARLLECLPSLVHDPNRPEDVLKMDCDEDGQGGDDAADACRYLVHTEPAKIWVRKLVGF